MNIVIYFEFLAGFCKELEENYGLDFGRNYFVKSDQITGTFEIEVLAANPKMLGQKIRVKYEAEEDETEAFFSIISAQGEDIKVGSLDIDQYDSGGYGDLPPALGAILDSFLDS